MDAFFLPVGSGQRFAIFHPAQGGTARGLVAYVHPFAEEMNKSRRMAALQAKALAAHGYAVLQLDLLGCGDSSGDFGDASWQAWVDDVVLACQWLRRQGDAPCGCGGCAPVACWQPRPRRNWMNPATSCFGLPPLRANRCCNNFCA